MPRCRENEKPYLTPDQLRRLLEHLDFRYRLLLEVAIFGAFTSSEIYGLTWQRYKDGAIQVRDSVYRGKLQMNRTKNKARANTVALPAAVADRLETWRRIVERKQGSPVAPDQLIFPSRAGTPLEMRNVWRAIKPIAEELGIEHNISMQVLRRSFATNAQDHGNPKDIQAHLRHANITTTLDIYTQKRPVSVKTMVEGLYDEVYRLKSAA